jgi:hypothetical protein
VTQLADILLCSFPIINASAFQCCSKKAAMAKLPFGLAAGKILPLYPECLVSLSMIARCPGSSSAGTFTIQHECLQQTIQNTGSGEIGGILRRNHFSRELRNQATLLALHYPLGFLRLFNKSLRLRSLP